MSKPSRLSYYRHTATLRLRLSWTRWRRRSKHKRLTRAERRLRLLEQWTRLQRQLVLSLETELYPLLPEPAQPLPLPTGADLLPVPPQPPAKATQDVPFEKLMEAANQQPVSEPIPPVTEPIPDPREEIAQRLGLQQQPTSSPSSPP